MAGGFHDGPQPLSLPHDSSGCPLCDYIRIHMLRGDSTLWMAPGAAQEVEGVCKVFQKGGFV